MAKHHLQSHAHTHRVVCKFSNHSCHVYTYISFVKSHAHATKETDRPKERTNDKWIENHNKNGVVDYAVERCQYCGCVSKNLCHSKSQSNGKSKWLYRVKDLWSWKFVSEIRWTMDGIISNSRSRSRTDGMARTHHKPTLNLFIWVYRFPFSHTNLHPSLS